MVDIKIDDIYRKPSNFFQLDVSSKGKIYKVPQDYEPSKDQPSFTIYDKESGGRFDCFKFSNNCEEIEIQTWMLKSFITKSIGIALKKNGYLTSKRGSNFDSSYLAYSLSSEIEHADKDIYRIFDGFEYRIVLIDGIFCFCINPHLKIKTESSIKYLLQEELPAEQVATLGAEYFANGERLRCNIISASQSKCRIRDIDTGEDKEVKSEDVFLISKPDILQSILLILRRKSNIIEIQRKYSFLSDKEASKARFHKTIEIAAILAEKIFPLTFGDFRVEFIPKTISLRM